jgi:hypothetical protein
MALQIHTGSPWVQSRPVFVLVQQQAHNDVPVTYTIKTKVSWTAAEDELSKVSHSGSSCSYAMIWKYWTLQTTEAMVSLKHLQRKFQMLHAARQLYLVSGKAALSTVMLQYVTNSAESSVATCLDSICRSSGA